MSDSNAFSITVSQPGLPSWYPASAGTIIDLSQTLGDASTQYSAAIAAGAGSYPGSTSPNLDIYSGGALVYESGRPFLYIMGGGHGDGSWNGIIKYGPLWGAGSNTPTWSLAAAASAVGLIQSDVAVYADGHPASSHTYTLLTGIGAVFYGTRLSAVYGGGSSGADRPYRYNSADGTWLVYSATMPNDGFAGGGGGAAAYGNRLFHFGGSGYPHSLKIFDLAAQTWSIEPNGGLTLFGDTCPMAVDTTRGALLAVGGGAGAAGIYWPNLTTFAGRRQNIATFSTGNMHAMAYDADRDVFVAPAHNSQIVYECSASALASGGTGSWVARSPAFTGATPSAMAGRIGDGTNGRFQYIPELKGYINVPASTSHVYFYRAT